MLGGERQVGRVDDLSYAPTVGQTFNAAISKSAEEVRLLRDYILPGASTDEQHEKTAARLTTINEILSDPRQGFGQQSLNAVGSVVGSILPTLPFALVGGAVGAGVAGVVGFGARQAALELGEGALTKYLATQVPLKALSESALRHYLPKASAGKIAAGITESYTGYKGFVIPEHFAEHYNAVEKSLDKNHAIEDWASDNYGFLLGAAPLVAGYVAFKGVRGVIAHRTAISESKALDEELGRLLREHEEVRKQNAQLQAENLETEAKISELQDHLQQAEEMGFISHEMHEWYLNYLENPNDTGKVHEVALKALESLQIPYDRVTGRVWNEVLSREGVKNLQASLFDEGITNFSQEENQLLSSYIIHNELDGYVANMRENPNLLTALKGLTHNIGSKIEAHSKALHSFDFALKRILTKGVLKKHIFTQYKIFHHLKKFQNSLGRGVVPRDIPYYLPKNVALKLKLEHQISQILSQRTPKLKAMFARGEHISLKEKLKSIKFQTPHEELQEIHEKLMPEGKLTKDFRNRRAYYRLEDLSQVSGEARALLDRINMEAINAKQEGLNGVLKKFIEMVDSNASRLADPDSVKRYLHTRMEQSVPVTREFEQLGINFEADSIEIERAIAESQKPEVLYDPINTEKVRASEFAFAKEQFEFSEKKYKQFNENTEALNELINCALGE